MPTFEEAIQARNAADKLKAQKSPLSPDQQQTLDAAEKTFTRRTEQNILNQQTGIASPIASLPHSQQKDSPTYIRVNNHRR